MPDHQPTEAATTAFNQENYHQVIKLLADLDQDQLSVQSCFILGSSYYKLNDFINAEQYLRAVVAAKPKHILATIRLANCYFFQKDYAAACQQYKNVLQHDANNLVALTNLGNASIRLLQWDQAEAYLKKALSINQQYVDALSSMGVLCSLKAEFDLAIEYFNTVLTITPDDVKTKMHRGVCYLTQGRYALGWPDLECRPDWQLAKERMLQLVANVDSVQVWDGNADLQGKKILIISEQGFGDCIQFIRFTALLAGKGARLYCHVFPALRELFNTLPWSWTLASGKQAYDYWIPLLSIPQYFSQSVAELPVTIPYLSAQKDKVTSFSGLFATNKLKIGLQWQGNPKHTNDEFRSLGLKYFFPLLSQDKYQFYSISHQTFTHDKELMNQYGIVDLSQHIHNFADTAAMLEYLDLVICVDTALVHLCGAVGKTCWLLTAYSPDWRWLLSRDDSPWYPSITLFRQQSPGDWRGVMTDVNERLKKFPCDQNKSATTSVIQAPSPSAPQEEPYWQQGVQYVANNQWFRAARSFYRNVKSNRYIVDSLSGLAIVYAQNNRPDQADEFFKRSLHIDNDNANTLANYIVFLMSNKRYSECESCLLKLIKKNVDTLKNIKHLVNIYKEQKQFKKAKNLLLKLIKKNHNNPYLHILLSDVFFDMDRLDEAQLYAEKALKLDKENINYQYKMAMIQLEKNHYRLASELFENIIAKKKDHVESIHNLAVCNNNVKRFNRAQTLYKQALSCNPNYSPSRVNLALLQLLLGNYKEGWKNFEVREDFEKATTRMYEVCQQQHPVLWDGSASLVGKNILIVSEQGYGDNIQFSRYFQQLNGRGASVYFYVYQELMAVFNTLPYLFSYATNKISYDYWLPLMSLAKIFTPTSSDIPNSCPYLYADKEKVAALQHLTVTNKKRVAIVWRGNKHHVNDNNRSMSLDSLRPLLSEVNTQFYSLQFKPSRSERQILQYCNVVDLSGCLSDFSDTAALLAHVDLLISVDTSIVHLAGAMNVPCWLLLPYIPDWRWGLKQEQSSWYQSVYLFRQSKRGDWASLISYIRSKLACHNNVDNNFLAVNDQANKLAKVDQIDQELLLYKEILKDDPHNYKAWFNLARIYLSNKQYFLAVRAYLKAYQINNTCIESLNSLAVIYAINKRRQQALEYWQKALAIDNYSVLVLENLVNFYPNDADVYERIHYLQLLCEVQPENKAPLMKLASSLMQNKQYIQAIDAYKALLAIQGDAFQCYLGMGISFSELGQYHLARDNFELAMQLDVSSLDLLYRLARVYYNLDDLYSAAELLRSAANIDTTDSRCNCLAALICFQQADMSNATLYYTKLLDSQHDNLEIKLALGMVYLTQKKFSQGWGLYESRIGLYGLKNKLIDYCRNAIVPEEWSGKKSLVGKTILIISEQGLGDFIQFCRYIPLIEAQGATVYVTVPSVLKPLIRSMPGSYQVHSKKRSYDFWISLLSIPKFFTHTEADIPCPGQYLFAEESKVKLFREKMSPKLLKVGIKWKGSTSHLNDHRRSMPLSTLAPLFLTQGVQFYSVEIEPTPVEKMLLATSGVVDLTESISDFSDTAGLVDNLDLVISVDTSLVHLAGAMNKPCWVMLAKGPDWRWFLDQEDSPWYKSVRLFRQPRFNDWHSVIDSIKQALSEWVANRA